MFRFRKKGYENKKTEDTVEGVGGGGGGGLLSKEKHNSVKKPYHACWSENRHFFALGKVLKKA